MTEISDEQRAAVEWLRTWSKPGSYVPAKAHAAVLLATLPPELTNPQPELPTEFGAAITGQFEGGQVVAVRGVQAWSVLFVDHGNHEWHSPENMALQISDAVPLVPKRPQITALEVINAVTSSTQWVMGTESWATSMARALNGIDQ